MWILLPHENLEEKTHSALYLFVSAWRLIIHFAHLHISLIKYKFSLCTLITAVCTVITAVVRHTYKYIFIYTFTIGQFVSLRKVTLLSHLMSTITVRKLIKANYSFMKSSMPKIKITPCISAILITIFP